MVDQIAVTTFTSPASGDPALFSVTHPSITETFKAAIFIFTDLNSDSSDGNGAVLGMGFIGIDSGAATEEQCICAVAEDVGGAAPDTGTAQSTTTCITVSDSTNVLAAAKVVASFSSVIAGGVELNFTTRAIQVKVTAILFAGLSKAYVTNVGSGTSSALENTGGTTDFEPDLLITIPSNGTNNTANVDAEVGIGFALNRAGTPQVAGYVDWDDATEPTDADGRLASAAFIARMGSTRVDATSVASFAANGFNHIATAAGTNAHVLALKFSGNVRLACANLAVSASAARQDFNTFGFTPDLVLGFASLLGSVDSAIDGATAGAGGYFVSGRYGSRAATASHQEGLGPGTGIWKARSRQEDAAVLLYDHTGAVAQRATWLGATGSGGFALDFSTASSAGFLTALGIQLVPNPPLPVRRRDLRRRARARLVRRPTIIGGRPVGQLPLGVRFWKAIARIRRAAQARLRARPIFPLHGVRVTGVATTEGSKGRVFTPGMRRGKITWTGTIPERDP